MMVRPELMSARRTPSTSPLNICETRLTQLITDEPRPSGCACRRPGARGRMPPRAPSLRTDLQPKTLPASRSIPKPASAVVDGFCGLRNRDAAPAGSGVVAGLAAERVGLLHHLVARHDVGDLPVVLLVLHRLGILALDDDDRTDELVVFGTEVHVADEGREGLALLVGLDDVGRIEGARLLDHAGPDRERHVGVLGAPLRPVAVLLVE